MENQTDSPVYLLVGCLLILLAPVGLMLCYAAIALIAYPFMLISEWLGRIVFFVLAIPVGCWYVSLFGGGYDGMGSDDAHGGVG